MKSQIKPSHKSKEKNHEKIQQFTLLFGLFLLALTACTSVTSASDVPTIAPASTLQVTQTQTVVHETQATLASSPTPEAGKTRTFSSDTYHYQFSYPDDWKVQVNTAIPSGAGSNPEYVTVTANDGSNLPQIAVEVLTDAPPFC